MSGAVGHPFLRAARHPAALAAGLLAGGAVGLLSPSTARDLAPLGRSFVDVLRVLAPITLLTVVPAALAALPWGRLAGVTTRATTLALAASLTAAVIGATGGLWARVPAGLAPRATPARPWDAFTRSLDDLTLLALLVLPLVAWFMARARADIAWARTARAAAHGGRRLIDAVLVVAPLGVFALGASFAASAAGGALRAAMGVVALVWGAQVGTLLAVLVAAAVGGTAGRVLLAGARDALVTAFVTGSSAATLPVEWRVAEERLAVPPALAALLVPAGSLVSKVGTTTFLSALAVVALRAGGPVEPLAWLLAVLGAVVLGAVTPPVSGGGLVMLGVLTTWVGADPGLAPVLIAIPFVGKLNTPLNVLARLAVVTRCVR